ncbi:MAG: divergent polysaccharide deacetylase family protein [Xanthobacteraceae bacterium]
MAGALAAFLGLFVLWATLADDPYGGEPMAVVSANLRLPAKTSDNSTPQLGVLAAAKKPDGQALAPALPPAAGAPPNTTTVTIIDGKTGAKQEVSVPGPVSGPAPAKAEPVDSKFVEMTTHGAIPKIAADGTRPADAFARPVQPLPGKPNAPRIALIVDGLGISANATSDAIAKLPGEVTLGFVPYGAQVASLAAQARASGHEILLQVPMEPFDYPDNDPGPQTLLTSLTPEQNIERLHWVMSQFQGYVGLANSMGARFTASETSFAPILRETAKRGLIFVDDGSNPRSVAGQIAGANNLPFARADVVIDAVPSPGEIDRALGRLEMAARERNVAVGVASALPVSIQQIAKWAKSAASRGLLLVPITAVAIKGKPSTASE